MRGYSKKFSRWVLGLTRRMRATPLLRDEPVGWRAQAFGLVLKSLVLVAVLVAVVGLAAWIQPEYLKINEVMIAPDGAEEVLFQQIRRTLWPQLKEIKGQYLWQPNLEKILKMIEGDQRVESVRINRRWPNHLEVKIRPHRAVLSLLRADGTFYPVAQDASLLPASRDYLDLPVLRGELFFKQSDLRTQALQLLSELPSQGPLQVRTVSEIKYDEGEGFSIFLVATGTQVRFGHEDYARRAVLVERVLGYLESHQMQARVIDARFSKKVVVQLRGRS